MTPREAATVTPWGDDPSRPGLPAPLDDRDGLAVPGDREPGGFLPHVQELRFIRESPGNVADHVDYAIDGAYAMPDSAWQKAHILYAYTVAAPGIAFCRLVEWAFFHRLSRALLSVPVLFALAWLLNRVPVVEWFVPDWLDATSWFAPAPVDPATVEIPIESGQG